MLVNAGYGVLSQGHAVLATSYALMLYLAHNEIQNSVPIMKWLQTQRSNYLQFSGTQDLLVVLQVILILTNVYKCLVPPEKRHILSRDKKNRFQFQEKEKSTMETEGK